MALLQLWLTRIEGWVWGIPLLVLLTSVGFYLTIALRGIQFRYLIAALKLAFSRQDDRSQGDISQFQSLTTALAGMVGIGSITGVATAVAMGGLGSLFWMWAASLIGMATKYAEAILAVKYRSIDAKGEMCGGPMYYLEKGFKSKGLAIAFAVLGAMTALGTGNMVQANSIALAMEEWVHIDPLWLGMGLAGITAAALFGGIKRIGRISSWLVPAMAVFYTERDSKIGISAAPKPRGLTISSCPILLILGNLRSLNRGSFRVSPNPIFESRSVYILGGLSLIAIRFSVLPHVFAEIFHQAFSSQAAFGGFAGSSVMMAIQYGVSRSVFSFEAGLGSAPIAAAAAKTDVPGRHALISMSGVFITSMIVCSITGLAIAASGLIGGIGSDGAVSSFPKHANSKKS